MIGAGISLFGHSAASYQRINTNTTSYLLVGGGGGGGAGTGGSWEAGGGAGGVVYGSSFVFTPGTTYNIYVGQGGLYNATGGNTIALNLTAYGGGFGGYSDAGGTGSHSGGSGGSGGGGYSASGGSGTLTQGFSGGTPDGTLNNAGGGGGGAGAPGSPGYGGIGIQNPIAGSTVGQLSAGMYWIAGGGSGISFAGLNPEILFPGGLGGGGNGGFISNGSTVPTAGMPNTGGGGGGYNRGGSGVVVLSVPTSAYSGITTGSPTITAYGSNTLITFLSSGSYTA